MTDYDIARFQVTQRVLNDVAAERGRQVRRYGDNDDLEDGTGPNVRWLGRYCLTESDPAKQIELSVRSDYEEHERENGKPTWMHLVREEVAEAFAESDPTRLRAELIQVAALAVSWIEKLDARR
jgi:hypothetical protein